jgi:hypothetical protein
LDEIIKVKVNRDVQHIWEAANKAYLYCGKAIEKELTEVVEK